MVTQSIFPKFIGEAEAQDLQNQIEKIAEQLIERNVQFLFGAGMSKQSEIPTGPELAVRFLDLIYPSVPSHK